MGRPTQIHQNTHACVNVMNEGDNKCFLWAVLASGHYDRSTGHVLKPHHLAEFEQEIDMTDISYPVEVRDFEKIKKIIRDLPSTYTDIDPLKRKTGKRAIPYSPYAYPKPSANVTSTCYISQAKPNPTTCG